MTVPWGPPSADTVVQGATTIGAAALRGYDRVLLDIGGVLTSDPWESIILTPGRGLADRLGLDRGTAGDAAGELWSRYAVRPGEDEWSYWADFGDLVGRRITRAEVRAATRDTLLVNAELPHLCRLLAEASCGVGLCTDNTPFWFDEQMTVLDRLRPLEPPAELVFVSCRVGLRKSSDPSLYAVVRDALDPGSTLVVDDRPSNIDIAAAHGFRTLHYTPTTWVPARWGTGT